MDYHGDLGWGIPISKPITGITGRMAREDKPPTEDGFATIAEYVPICPTEGGRAMTFDRHRKFG
jgi:hypothetical protein